MLDEILDERVVSSRGRRSPRAVKRKLSKFPVRRRKPPDRLPGIAEAVRIIK